LTRTIARTYILAPRGAFWVVFWRPRETRQDMLVLGPASLADCSAFISSMASGRGEITDCQRESDGVHLTIQSPAWRHHYHKEIV